MSKRVDLTGKKFGYLTAIKPTRMTEEHSQLWLCRCDCGNFKEVEARYLKRKRPHNCGCMTKKLQSSRSENHGASGTRLYYVWYSIRCRCEREYSSEYQNYGGRGISVCAEWRDSFPAFQEWALSNGYDENAPRGECTIDRIDVDGDYEPSNCRWVDITTQANNRRNNRYVTIDGVTKTITEWCRETGIKSHIAYWRIKSGWEPARAVTEPYNREEAMKAALKASSKSVIVDGKDVYESIKAAAKAIGVSPSTLSESLKNGWKAGGHNVSYAKRGA